MHLRLRKTFATADPPYRPSALYLWNVTYIVTLFVAGYYLGTNANVWTSVFEASGRLFFEQLDGIIFANAK